MYALVHKELYISKLELTQNSRCQSIVKTKLTPNCGCQSWEGRQICLCESKEPLQQIIDSMDCREREKFYIEKLGGNENVD